MVRTAFQFPGQGSQYVGMGAALWEASSLARSLFARVDEALGFSLSSLCFSGPEEALRRTEHAQPALFAVGAIACTVLRERGIEPMAVAGHSVGEYTALYAAGALDLDDGLRIVRTRGELMAQAAGRVPGTMAAIVGLPPATVEALCATASALGPVEVANENGPGQTVVSGAPAAVERVMALAEEHEGTLAVPLAVSGAFHSSLMAPAAAAMTAALAALPLRTARIPVVTNVTGTWVRDPAEMRDALARHLTCRVCWTAALSALAALGAERLIEVGPGRTLTRLARDVVPELWLVAGEDLLAPGEVGARGR